MADFIPLDLTADAAALAADAEEFLTAQAPDGYTPDKLTQWVLSAVARIGVEVVVMTGRMPLAVFQVFGTRVLNIPANVETAATGTAILAINDNPAGRTLLAGATFDLGGIGFQSTVDVTAPAGNLNANIPIIALEAGAAGSGLDGTAQLITPAVTWIDSVAVITPTTGGIDGETDEQYVDRLADEIPTLSPKAILAADFEVLARRDSEAQRALVLDNYVPAGPGGTPAAQTGVAGAVTVAVQGPTGEPVSTGSKTRIETALEADRVLNIDVHVIDPTYTLINVSFTAKCYPDYDPATVEAAGEAAISTLLSPATWGQPVGGDQRDWIDEPTVLRLDLVGALYKVAGIRHVTALTLAINPAALGTADLTLPGPAGLPRPNTIAGTVTT